MRSSVASPSGRPNAMLLARESENRNGSCGTTAIARRSVRNGYSRTSMPSMKTVPGGGSCSRGNRFSSVDLPAPVGPTNATVWPGRIVSDTSCSTGRAASKPKVSPRNSIAPATRVASATAGTGGSVMAGGSSITSRIRPHDAMPRCIMLVTQPNAIIGQLSIVR